MLLKELLVRLPESLQNWLIARAMRSGRVLDTPVFGMLMRTLEFYGGDVAEIEAVCRAAGRGRAPTSGSHDCSARKRSPQIT